MNEKIKTLSKQDQETLAEYVNGIKKEKISLASLYEIDEFMDRNGCFTEFLDYEDKKFWTELFPDA
jgi:hypothetical protein